MSAKNYVFTVNNYEALLDPSIWPSCVYCHYQEEIGSETHTIHLQGFVCFSERRTMATVSALPGLEGACLAVMKGSVESNVIYCTKSETKLDGPYSWGEAPAGQGARSDLLNVAKDIKRGASLKRIAEDYPAQFIRYHSGFKALQCYTAPSRATDPMSITQCLVIVGTGGTGKSQFARRLATMLSGDEGASGATYSLPEQKGSGLYFDGYNGGDVLLMEEFNGSRMTPQFFNQLIDAGEFRIPVHGGSVQFNSRYVIITCNDHPNVWWKALKHKYSLFRRILILPLFRRYDVHSFAPKLPTVYFDVPTATFIHRRRQ